MGRILSEAMAATALFSNNPSTRHIVAARLLGLSITTLSAVTLFATPSYSGEAYLGGGLGLNFAADADITGTGIDTSVEFDPGPVAVIAAGYSFDNGFRSELELAGRWNDAETVGGASGSGDTTAFSGMLNILYDVDIDNGGFTPYVGAGLGAAHIEDSGISSVNGSSISDDDTVLAYQAMAGISYDLNQMWALTADYRYFSTGDVSLTTASSVAVDQEYANHSVLIGLRLDLGGDSSSMPEPSAETPPSPTEGSSLIADAPPPSAETAMEPDTSDDAASDMTQLATAPAAATPEFPRAYRLLFDWDKNVLNPLALDTIAAIAMNAKEGEVISIRATGHADRSGPEAYNENLSRERAEAVRKALIGLGIPADRIVVDWRGENDPVVATADGVREQQNRRVEIVFPAN